MKGEKISVRHYGPGGRDHGGGIGRFIGYLTDAPGGRSAVHAITDTRGPQFTIAASAVRFASALLAMGTDRVAAPGRIHHIHMAGRGSTLRKLLLCGLARGLGCCHILHLHDYDYASDLTRRPPRLHAAIARMFRGADAVIVLGQQDRQLVVDRLGVSADRVVVMQNCVPDPGPQRCAEAATDRTTGAATGSQGPTILFLGRLGERKGVPELLAALAGPAMGALPWRAVLAGDGPVEIYRAKARALGIAKRVEMPGWVGTETVDALCRSADILVLPSHAEGMSMAVLEGMAHGLAVITTRVGAHDEAITDRASGLFVGVGNVSALEGALCALVRSPDLRAALGQNARAAFLARFSMAACLPRLDDLYDAIDHRDRARSLRRRRTV